MHVCDVCFFVSYEGSDAVSCGSDEEARLYGRSPELHLSSQSCTPTGKPEVGSDSELASVFAVASVKVEMWRKGLQGKTTKNYFYLLTG